MANFPKKKGTNEREANFFILFHAFLVWDVLFPFPWKSFILGMQK
jgi:hypothetical protein